MRDDEYDVIVVGGGAGGLSAALTLARSRRSVLVVDAGAPRNAPAAGVHNYLSRDGLPPRELLALGRAEVIGYGGEIVDGEVTAVTRAASPEPLERVGSGEDLDGEVPAEASAMFHVELRDGRGFRARRVVVATGLVDELPDVPGLAERWGRDVLHCPYCHGWEVRDRTIAVLGTGPLAMHQTLLFRQLSEQVTLVVHAGAGPGDAEREQLAALGVAIVEEAAVGLEVVDDRVTGLRLVSGAVVPAEAVVVGPRFVARAAMLAPLGLEAVEQQMGEHVLGSAVPADPMGATAVPGVWVVGNVADMQAQVGAAAAAGVRSAAAVNADLAAEDARIAVAARRAATAVTGGRG